MNILQAFARMQLCRDLAVFYRRWAAAEAAGLPLSAAISGLTERAAKPIEARAQKLSLAIQQGTLSLREDRSNFTAVEVAFINVGMSTGNLDGALASLANMY